MADLGDTFKKVFLAGIGAAAETTQKAQDLLDEMVKKGELTVEQGKALNQELKHDAESKWKEVKKRAEDSAEKKAEEGKEEKDDKADKAEKTEKAESAAEKAVDFAEILKNLSADDLRDLKKKLDSIDIDSLGKEEKKEE